jgi:hypothetical protein
MQLTILSTLCFLFFAFMVSAIPSAGIQGHEAAAHLSPRGFSVSNSPGKLHIHHRGHYTMDRPADFEQQKAPVCEGKAARKLHCELSCRCTDSGGLLCGTDLGFGFRSWGRSGLLPQNQLDVAQARLASVCSQTACSCLHVVAGTPRSGGDNRLSRNPSSSSSERETTSTWGARFEKKKGYIRVSPECR